MPRTVYVDGRYAPICDPNVLVEDRALQFSDGIYEVIAVVKGRILDLDRHLRRLAISLEGLDIPFPMSNPSLSAVIGETVRQNRIRDGLAYIQVTRGSARRNHVPSETTSPSLIVTARPARFPAPELAKGVAVITAPDLRWGRCDLKTTSLLANVLAKREAVKKGAFECWMVNANGFITEGGSSNAWIVNGSCIQTHPLGTAVLAGITREVVIEMARVREVMVEEKAFTVDEARSADEAFLTSTSSFVVPVHTIDGKQVGDGNPGTITRRIAKSYLRRVREGV